MARPKSGRNLLTRLLDKIEVDSNTDCWLWLGGKNNIGYGMIRDEKKMRTTHRVSYEEHTNTKIPAGMCVCHTCDNPLCVNPAHLWLGSRKDNTDDMISKGRQVFWGGGMVGRKQPRTNCPHCLRSISNNMYSRWHGDNCRSKSQA
jgi:hypothetical protein